MHEYETGIGRRQGAKNKIIVHCGKPEKKKIIKLL
jgi:hypothetical protein